MNVNLKYENSKISPTDMVNEQKLIQCKLCQEMFEFDFNYEEILKSKNFELVKKMFEPIEKSSEEMKGYFSRDNMEFVTKEISIQYFFKGGESQIEEIGSLKFKECKKKRSDECDGLKLGICEKVLSYERGVCVDLKNNYKNLIRRGDFSKKNENLKDFDKFVFKQQEDKDKDPEIIKQYGEISLLDVSQGRKSFDPTPKTQWKPPKPVLLGNFQQNIGDQLKDISSLANEISHLEKRLQLLKQQLANKLEVAQSSYNVVQKTLSEISKMVSQPNLSSIIKNSPTPTEDDWDESAKPKFLNK